MADRPTSRASAAGKASGRAGAPPLDRDAIEQLVLARAGELRAELAEALLSELRLEVARLTPARPGSSDQSSSTCPALVRNKRTKEVHVVAIGPDSGRTSACWTSLCGWSFGQWGGFTLEGGPLEGTTCKRCAKFARARLNL